MVLSTIRAPGGTGVASSELDCFFLKFRWLMPDGLESRASGPYRNHSSHRPTKRSDFVDYLKSLIVD